MATASTAALVAAFALPASGESGVGSPAARAKAAQAARTVHHAGAPQGTTVVADHLNNPRGLALAHGALYVAEAGSGGDLCLDEETCAGTTGSVTKVWHGKQRRVATGFFSAAGPDGSFAVGSDDVSVVGRTLFVQETSAGCEPVPGLPADFAAQLGNLLKVKEGNNTKRAVADIDDFECANDPDGQGPESDPYSVLALSVDHQVVADAAGDTLLDVRHGKVSLLAVFPPSANGRDPVPTSIALGPDGAYYVGTLAEGAGNGGANVWRVKPGHAPTVFASGFTAITDLAFGPDGSLYVCEFSTDVETFSPLGDVVRVRRNGARTQLGLGSLFFPGGLAVDRKGHVYVSNWSILPANGSPDAPPDARGQVVRLGH